MRAFITSSEARKTASYNVLPAKRNPPLRSSPLRRSPTLIASTPFTKRSCEVVTSCSSSTSRPKRMTKARSRPSRKVFTNSAVALRSSAKALRCPRLVLATSPTSRGESASRTALVTRCARPSDSIEKSSAARPSTASPFLSFTTTSRLASWVAVSAVTDIADFTTAAPIAPGWLCAHSVIPHSIVPVSSRVGITSISREWPKQRVWLMPRSMAQAAPGEKMGRKFQGRVNCEYPMNSLIYG